MAWVTITGSNNLWQYENGATASNTYADSAAGANSVISGGIRTFTKPGTSDTTKTYIRARRMMDTNYQLYSQNLGHSGWTKRGNCTVTANAGAAPDGTNTSSLVSNVSGSAGGGTYSDVYYVVNSGDSTSGVAYEASFWIKRISGTATNLIFTNPQNGAQGTWGIAYQSLTIGEWTHIHSKHPLVTINNVYTSSSSGRLGSNFKIDNSLNHNATFEIWGVLINKGTSVGKYSKAVATASFIERGEVSKSYFDAQ